MVSAVPVTVYDLDAISRDSCTAKERDDVHLRAACVAAALPATAGRTLAGSCSHAGFSNLTRSCT